MGAGFARFFEGRAEAARLFAPCRPPCARSGPSQRRVAKSEVAFARRKQAVKPAPGRFLHHLALRRPEDVDDEVRARLREARAQAGR